MSRSLKGSQPVYDVEIRRDAMANLLEWRPAGSLIDSLGPMHEVRMKRSTLGFGGGLQCQVRWLPAILAICMLASTTLAQAKDERAGAGASSERRTTTAPATQPAADSGIDPELEEILVAKPKATPTAEERRRAQAAWFIARHGLRGLNEEMATFFMKVGEQYQRDSYHDRHIIRVNSMRTVDLKTRQTGFVTLGTIKRQFEKLRLETEVPDAKSHEGIFVDGRVVVLFDRKLNRYIQSRAPDNLAYLSRQNPAFRAYLSTVSPHVNAVLFRDLADTIFKDYQAIEEADPETIVLRDQDSSVRVRCRVFKLSTGSAADGTKIETIIYIDEEKFVLRRAVTDLTPLAIKQAGNVGNVIIQQVKVSVDVPFVDLTSDFPDEDFEFQAGKDMVEEKVPLPDPNAPDFQDPAFDDEGPAVKPKDPR